MNHQPAARAARPGLRALLALLLALLPTALAQDLTADEVLAELERKVDSLADASFLLTGGLIDPDGTEIRLEVEVEVVTEPQVARATFIQPDALADNFIVLSGGAIYNYTYLTNQVTVFDADDPDALGGLLGEPEPGEKLEFTLDLQTLFSGWAVSSGGYVQTPAGDAYLLLFANEEEGAAIGSAEATVLDGSWVPYTVTLYDERGSMVADLAIEGFAGDTGLDPADVTYIPDDAEVIDERSGV